MVLWLASEDWQWVHAMALLLSRVVWAITEATDVVHVNIESFQTVLPLQGRIDSGCKCARGALCRVGSTTNRCLGIVVSAGDVADTKVAFQRAAAGYGCSTTLGVALYDFLDLSHHDTLPGQPNVFITLTASSGHAVGKIGVQNEDSLGRWSPYSQRA